MRILVIAYYFPPLSGGGSQRPLRWLEGLPELGHEVAVLTHSYGPGELTPPVYRVHDPSSNNRRHGLGAVRWAILRALTELRNRRGDARSIFSWWCRAAERALPQIVASFRPQVVLPTYSPVECLELGLAAAERWQLPLVADFRDGLLFEPIESRRLARYPAVAHEYERLEAAVLERAAAVTVALPDLAADFRQRHGELRVEVLPNCFDPRRRQQVEAVKLNPDKLHLVHTGAFAASDASCDIAPFVDAVERVIAADPGRAARLRIHQLGRLTRRERRLVAGLQRHGVFVAHGSLSHERCLAFQKAADLALLITSTTRPGVIPGKLFEYLGAGCPILALAAGTEAARIVEATGSGWIAAPDDPAAIVALLEKLLDPACRGSLEPRGEAIARYQLSTHLRQLDELLRSLPRRSEDD